jgi:hypothetical protein
MHLIVFSLSDSRNIEYRTENFRNYQTIRYGTYKKLSVVQLCMLGRKSRQNENSFFKSYYTVLYVSPFISLYRVSHKAQKYFHLNITLKFLPFAKVFGCGRLGVDSWL